jgi:hypothetical protein
MAAVLAAGAGAALSHLSAAALWEIWRRRTFDADVVSPRRRRPETGIRLRWCRRLDRRDVTVHAGIPVTTVARTLIDLSSVLSAQQLANVIHEAAFRNRFDVDRTGEAMARANGRHDLDVLERAVALNAAGSAGTRSSLEDRFLALIRSAGLPEPLPNVGVQAGGRRIEVDFQWPDVRLCVEIEGDGHTRPTTRRDDEMRDSALRAAGHEVLRFSGHDVDKRPASVLARLASKCLRSARTESES